MKPNLYPGRNTVPLKQTLKKNKNIYYSYIYYQNCFPLLRFYSTCPQPLWFESSSDTQCPNAASGALPITFLVFCVELLLTESVTATYLSEYCALAYLNKWARSQFDWIWALYTSGVVATTLTVYYSITLRTASLCQDVCE